MYRRTLRSGTGSSATRGSGLRERSSLLLIRLCAYETRRSPCGELLNRGGDSIQLFRRDRRWWISAMLWRRETHTVKILDAQ